MDALSGHSVRDSVHKGLSLPNMPIVKAIQAMCLCVCAGSVQIPWERAISPNKVPYYIK